MAFIGPDFSSIQNPQFQKPATLVCDNGENAYVAQKHNQTYQLV